MVLCLECYLHLNAGLQGKHLEVITPGAPSLLHNAELSQSGSVDQTREVGGGDRGPPCGKDAGVEFGTTSCGVCEEY